MHNRQGLTLRLLWASLMDYDLWPLYAISFTLLIPTNPVSAYLTLNLKSLGFDTFETNLLTVPAYVLFLIQLVFWSWISDESPIGWPWSCSTRSGACLCFWRWSFCRPVRVRGLGMPLPCCLLDCPIFILSMADRTLPDILSGF